MSVLFEPVALGELQLANRIVMAPMTRSRALADAVPGGDMVEYYRQRASAGLIVAEGTAPSACTASVTRCQPTICSSL